jgi:hypothetical protein
LTLPDSNPSLFTITIVLFEIVTQREDFEGFGIHEIKVWKDAFTPACLPALLFVLEYTAEFLRRLAQSCDISSLRVISISLNDIWNQPLLSQYLLKIRFLDEMVAIHNGVVAATSLQPWEE